LIALAGLTLTAVIKRYFLNSPLPWAEEVQMLLLLWAVMLGGVIAAWERVALAIDFIHGLVPPAVKNALDKIILTVTALSMLPLVYYGWQLALGAKSKMTNILFIPYFYIDLAVPVGAAGIGLVSLAHLFNLIKQDQRKVDEEDY